MDPILGSRKVPIPDYSTKVQQHCPALNQHGLDSLSSRSFGKRCDWRDKLSLISAGIVSDPERK